MKNVFLAMLLVGLTAPVLAAQVENKQAEVLQSEPVNLKPLVVTPSTAAIETISRGIVAQMLENESWALPALVAPEKAGVG